ncbi:MAG: methyltransferase domain-containing protein [Chromatiaceae bacterium]|nr:methyltransferase domain-containing protein [Chromatiaceae bacterium]
MHESDAASQGRLDVDALIAQIKAEAASLGDATEPRVQKFDLPSTTEGRALGQEASPTLGRLLSALSNQAFLDEAYRTLLGRAPDPSGLSGFQRRLDRGGSRLLVLYMLRYSAEGKARAGAASTARRTPRLLRLLRQPMLTSRVLSYFRRGGTAAGLLRALKTTSKEAPAAPIANTLAARSTEVTLKPAPWLWLYRLSPVKRPLGPLLRYSERRYLIRHPELFAQQVLLESSRKIEQVDEKIELQQLALEQVDEKIELQRSVLDETAEMATKTSKALDHEVQVRDRLSKDLDFFRSDLIYHRTQTQELLTALRALPERPTQPSTTPSEPLQAALAASADDQLNAYYVAFEEEFRGSLEQIRATQQGYIADLQAAGVGTPEAPVLDLGCGRGEWLGLLAEQGLSAQGIDSNRVMVARCREQGLDARLGDVLNALQTLPNAALGALSAFHLIEHLPFAVLHALMLQAHRVLRPGGLLILETPNPENLLVGSHTFYHDPTHLNPMTPTATRFLVRYSGFSDPEIRRLHPYPEGAKVPGHDPLTERVNGHLCGPQDFAIIARKPSQSAQPSSPSQ